MTETTLPIEKKINYPGLISVWCGVVGFIPAIFLVIYQTKYHESLFTDKTSENFLGIWMPLWLILTAAGLLCWFMSLLLALPGSGRKRATGVILGILLPFIQAGFVMPTLGKMRSPYYYKVSDPAALEYLQKSSKDKGDIGPSFMMFAYDRNYSTDDIRSTIEVKYRLRPALKLEDINAKIDLKPEFKLDDLPKSFSVMIEGKTKKTEIKHENDVQQKAEETE